VLTRGRPGATYPRAVQARSWGEEQLVGAVRRFVGASVRVLGAVDEVSERAASARSALRVRLQRTGRKLDEM